MSYNRVNALMYELILFISRFWPGIKANPWIKRAVINCVDDWAEFRTQIVMTELKEDIDEIHQAWDEEEKKNSFTYIEEPSDGSPVQEILGGPIRVKATWAKEPRPSDTNF